MPTYEYICKSCGDNIEVFQSFSDKPLRKHDDCGGDLQKVFHARGVVFKGSGFYATDSRTSSSTAKTPSTSNGSSAKKAPAKSKTPSSTGSSDSK